MLFFRVTKLFILDSLKGSGSITFKKEEIYSVVALNDTSFGGFTLPHKIKYLTEGGWIVEETNFNGVNITALINSLLLARM